MGTSIPQGNETAEQPKSESVKEEKPASTFGNAKRLVIATIVVVLLVIAAVLIGVLPDWGKEESKKIDDEALKAESLFLESSDGPFNYKIPLFSSKVTQGYSSDEELEEDLKQLANFLLNQAVSSNVEAGRVVGGGDFDEGGPPVASPPFGAENDMAVEDGAAESLTQNTGATTLDNVNAYDTNSQEFTMERADFVKSDGNLVFAAYTDYLVVWTKDGQGILTQIQMPALNITGYPGGYPEPIWPLEPTDDTDIVGDAAAGGAAQEESDVAEDTTAASGGEEELVAEEEPAFSSSSARSSIWWEPKPRIEALLVHGNRLSVVISGYGTEHSQQLDSIPVLYEYLGTRIQVYDINDGDLQLVSETDINGSFRNAYSAEENAYIVTQSSINTWDHLVAPVQRWQPQFQGLDDEAYVAAVQEMVDNGLIENFVAGLVSELQVNGAIDLTRLSVFADSISEDNIEQTLFIDNVANAVTQVVAFDMTMGGNSANVETLSPDISGTFQPGSWGHVYAVGSMIIVADNGWSWIADDGESAQKTFLIGFRLDGPTSSHELVGTVDGYILNPFSLDYVEREGGNYVRIATTQDFWSPWRGGVLEDVGTVFIDEEPEEPPESRTLNLMIVLRVPDGPNADGEFVLEEVGSLELGEPNERYTTVRFFEDFAYAVTYEQIDPFYVVDLTGEVPVKAGELKIPGFSEYLHPIDSSETTLVAIGQHADDDGNILGLQLSLFDATDPSDPALIDRFVVEEEQNTWSSSTASWDERAFRFVSLGERTGKVIIPLSTYTYQEFDEVTGQRLDKPQEQNFEGFSVFDISNDEITKDFDIDHSFEIEYTEECDYWYDWLPERSFVFNGNVMTMKKHTIISTSLSTGETLWTTPINDALLGCKPQL